MTTVNPEEIEKFSRIAAEWWDPKGKFKPLHQMNPTRIGYIKEKIQDSGFRIQGLSILDVGCGGGLMSEPFARLGGQVTGVDASAKNIAVATLHAEQSGLDINYRAGEVSTVPEKFDVVLALEIVEHVADLEGFVRDVMGRVKPGGLVFFSTLNRTLKSYALAIIGAEYVLRWLPRGTHDWKKFLRPSELLEHVERNSGKLHHMTGMVMHPLTFEWRLDERDVSVNYLLCAIKDSASA